MPDETTRQTPEIGINLDIHRPHSARMYDYYLGGVTNFPADREAAGRALDAFPNARLAAHANRGFMHRSIRALAVLGVDQFLDVGTGIPTSPNLHEIAQRINPAVRAVYADNDPIVLTHAEALLNSTPEGRTAYVQGDVRTPDTILDAAAEILDLARPVALSMNALLHFIADRPDRSAADLVAAFTARLAPGSYLAISHFTPDFEPEATARLVEVYRNSGTEAQARTRDEIAALFHGWHVLDPGIVSTPRWRPDADTAAVTDQQASCYAAIARLD
ncbi:SAM-dependent methyltransferase [Kitasatospora sp. NA04385]|uniref:SAM-dependent methyltransferase n=1 Tax=Kitasatospora sp. NA04385 TaxID=2742135 RepID=UPI001592AAB1|nr:SAM-dependent methyltransferase [Kitasatospora sp. NA04385]QKW22371.1 SAM-dependent methyltransferase [Kitasatospora sp. NA04385]